MSPHAIEPQNVGMGPKLWITGLAAQYPPYLLTAEDIEQIADRFNKIESSGLKKLLQINRNSGIQTRSSISTYSDGFATQPKRPSITDLDSLFRTKGVELTSQACSKALKEWGGSRDSITHTVAVTCTNQGNPGYDMLVNSALGLSPSIDHTLLHGVGCAGGLAILRTAAQIALGASARRRPARILCYACELCTPNLRFELDAAEECGEAEVGIAAALFSDGAAAFVLCNEYGMVEDTRRLFEVKEWGCGVLPGTMGEMGCYAEPAGFRTILSRDIPKYTKAAVKPMFDRLLPTYRELAGEHPECEDFDWALHPGGQAVIEGVAELMRLTKHQLRATKEIYQTRGNSSSASVLIVLDKLRKLGPGSDHVVATSFGPGLSIEMALLRRWQEDEKR